MHIILMKEKIGVESMVGESFNIIILICIMIVKLHPVERKGNTKNFDRELVVSE